MITIKNIIFDLGGVLLRGHSYMILKEFGISDDEFEVLKKFFIGCHDLDSGECTVEERFNKFDFPKELVEKYKDKMITYYKYRKINYDLIDLIEKLKKNNYNVYILSDNNEEAIKYYKTLEVFKNFDGWVVSCDYKEVKKDGVLFDIFLEKFNLEAKECFMIDDRPENIEAANKRGIKGHVFVDENDVPALCEDLKNNGVNI